MGVPISACVFAAPAAVTIWPVTRIHRVPRVAGTHRRAVAAPGHVENGGLRSLPFVGEEVRHRVVDVVLRPLMHETHSVVQRQAVGHLPVILDKAFDLVVDHVAFDELRRLQVLREDSERRVRVTEAAVERIGRAVAEVHVPLEAQVRDAARARVLRLVTVVEIGPCLKRMPPHDLGHAARDILRVVDVQPAGELQVRRRGSNQAAPTEERRKIDGRAVPKHRLLRLQDLVIVISRTHDTGLWIQFGETGPRVSDGSTPGTYRGRRYCRPPTGS